MCWFHLKGAAGRHLGPHVSAWDFLPAGWLCDILLWLAKERAKLVRSYRWDPDCRPPRWPLPCLGHGGVLVCRGGTAGYIAPQTVKKSFRQQLSRGTRRPRPRRLRETNSSSVEGPRACFTFTFPRVHVCIRGGCAEREISVRQQTNKARRLKSGHLRDRGCQQKPGVWLCFSGRRAAVQPCQTTCERYLPLLGPPWVILRRTPPLSNGRGSALMPRWVPVTWINGAICIPFPLLAPITTLSSAVLSFQRMKAWRLVFVKTSNTSPVFFGR